MRIAKENMLPRAQDVRVEAVRAIVSRMGISRAAVFIREALAQPEDYLEIKEELFGDKTAKEICEEMKAMSR
jgi:hypothetical protein